ncbi:hypothetical protein Hanom_Chr01g00040101 [Helianthus anomalus]
MNIYEKGRIIWSMVLYFFTKPMSHLITMFFLTYVSNLARFVEGDQCNSLNFLAVSLTNGQSRYIGKSLLGPYEKHFNEKGLQIAWAVPASLYFLIIYSLWLNVY